jgi:uroporphyrinogen-III synthase
MIPEPTPLNGWTVLSLRPQNRHAQVRRAAAAWQARLLALSAFGLKPGADSVGLHEALACGIRIASSPAAVSHARRLAALGGDWLAIGQGTARQLLRAGARSVQTPEPQTADGLLELPALQGIRGKRIGLLTAPDGRGLLEDTLKSRGAELIVAHVYVREPVALNARQLAEIDALPAQAALLVTSQQAFGQFWRQLNPARQDKIKSLICIASSARLVEYLQAFGLTRVICSDSTLPQRQLRVLAETVMPAITRSSG